MLPCSLLELEIVYYHIAASDWILTGNRIQYTINITRTIARGCSHTRRKVVIKVVILLKFYVIIFLHFIWMECLNTQNTQPSTALVTMDSDDMVSWCWSRSQVGEIRSWFRSLSQACRLGLGLKQCGLWSRSYLLTFVSRSWL